MELLRMRLLACFLVVSILMLVASAPVDASSRSSLAGVTLWVDLLGANQADLEHSGQLKDLNKFQLVVVDVDSTGGNFTTDTLKQLRAGGVIVLSYLNLGACENSRSYWETACAHNALAPYENYPGEFWMDVSVPSWREAIVNLIAPLLFANGVDGFYLDNLDIVEVFPEIEGLAAGLHDIVTGLRSSYPTTLLVAQNGLSVMNHTSADGQVLWSNFDALAHEDVFSTYDFETSRYLPQVPVRTAELAARLTYYQGGGLKIFTVDYADTTDLAKQALGGALSRNFAPYVGPIELDSIAWWAYNRVIPEFPSGIAPVLLAIFLLLGLFLPHGKFVSKRRRNLEYGSSRVPTNLPGGRPLASYLSQILQ